MRSDLAGDSQRPSVEFRALDSAEAEQVPALWNEAWRSAKVSPNPYPLSRALWRERLNSRHHDPALLLGAIAGGRLLAVAYGKTPKSTWQQQGSGWLSLLAVAPEAQGRGLGTRLTAHLLSALKQRGATTVKFGGDADHLLPGPPQECPPALWRLLLRFGARFGNAEHDLHLDLRPEPPPTPLPDGWQLRTHEPKAALDFVAHSFPGRWHEELTDYLAAGALAITLHQSEEPGTESPAVAKGFCALFPGGERTTSPGLLWREALQREATSDGEGSRGATPEPVLAGIGPLGIAPELRGAGLGLALVGGAANYLRGRGVTDCVINWTTLDSFYGRLGARIWRSYQRAEAVMPSASSLLSLAAGEHNGAYNTEGRR